MESLQWRIEDIPVVVTPKTVLIGDIQEGRVVEVEGYTQPEGWIAADEVHLRYYEFMGRVEIISPEQWTIEAVQFSLLPTTQIDPGLRVGDRVLVLVYSSDKGILFAHALIRLPQSELTPPPATLPTVEPAEQPHEDNPQLQSDDKPSDDNSIVTSSDDTTHEDRDSQPPEDDHESQGSDD